MVVSGVAKTYRWLATVLKRRYFKVFVQSLLHHYMNAPSVPQPSQPLPSSSTWLLQLPSLSPPHHYHKSVQGAFHLVKISENFGSAVNGKRLAGSFHWKIPRKSGKSKKVGPLSRLEHSERNFVFIYTFLVLHTSCNSVAREWGQSN